MKQIYRYLLLFFLTLPLGIITATAQVPEGGFKVCVNRTTGNMRVRPGCLQNEKEMSTRVMKDLARESTPRNPQPEMIFQHPGVVVEKIQSVGNGYWRIEFRTPDNRAKKHALEVNSQTTKGSVEGYEYFIRW